MTSQFHSKTSSTLLVKLLLLRGYISTHRVTLDIQSHRMGYLSDINVLAVSLVTFRDCPRLSTMCACPALVRFHHVITAYTTCYPNLWVLSPNDRPPGKEVPPHGFQLPPSRTRGTRPAGRYIQLVSLLTDFVRKNVHDMFWDVVCILKN